MHGCGRRAVLRHCVLLVLIVLGLSLSIQVVQMTLGKILCVVLNDMTAVVLNDMTACYVIVKVVRKVFYDC